MLVRVARSQDVFSALKAAGLVDGDSHTFACLDAWKRDPAACAKAVGFLPLIPYTARGTEDIAGFFLSCPTCGCEGAVPLSASDGHATWTWNGEREKPTLTPSVRLSAPRGGCGGHWTITDGALVTHGDSACRGGSADD